MKKFAFIFVLTLLFCMRICIVTSAQYIEEKEAISSPEFFMEEQFDVVSYDPNTGEETISTMYAKDTYIMKEYNKVLSAAMEKEGNQKFDKKSFDASFTLVQPGYNPEESNKVKPLTVIGNDDRYRMANSPYPNGCILYLRNGYDTNGDGAADTWWTGSASMVGKQVLLTAAHCYYKSDYGWVKQSRTYVNQHSGTLNSTWEWPSSWVCPSNYTSTQDYKYDWCVVRMQNAIGSTTTGYFGYGNAGANSMLNNSYIVAGYPGQQGFTIFRYGCSGTVTSEDYYMTRYNADMSPGQSGGPVYSGTIVWAVNTYQASTYNMGNKITAWCFELITNARNATQ